MEFVAFVFSEYRTARPLIAKPTVCRHSHPKPEMPVCINRGWRNAVERRGEMVFRRFSELEDEFFRYRTRRVRMQSRSCSFRRGRRRSGPAYPPRPAGTRVQGRRNPRTDHRIPNRDMDAPTDNKKQPIRDSAAEFLVFAGRAGERSIEARCGEETIRPSRKLAATLFDAGANMIGCRPKKDGRRARSNWNATRSSGLSANGFGKQAGR